MHHHMLEIISLLIQNRHEEEDKLQDKKNEQTSPSPILDNKRIPSLKNKEGNRGTEAVVIITGILFVAGVAGFAAYQNVQFGTSTNPATVKFNTINDLTKDSPADSISFTRPRLPTDLLPQKYVLYLNPNVTTKTYTGLVKIRFQCLRSTQKIYLHSIQHVIQKIAIKTVNRTDIEDILIQEHSYHNHTEMVVLTFDQRLVQGYDYDLYIGFKGNLTTRISNGMYLSSYQMDSDEDSQVMVMANFKPTLARKIFPCFDEPKFKAHFQLIIAHDKEFDVRSNAPVSSKVTVEDTNLVETHFHLTQYTMSTYHITFVMFKNQLENTNNQLKPIIDLLAPEKRRKDLDYAIGIVPTLFNYFQSSMKMNYPFTKLELSPARVLSADVSETIGLVHLYEPLLMYNTQNSSLQDFENVAVAVSNAIAEQWISGSVTTKSWHEEWFTKALLGYLKYNALSNIAKWEISSMFFNDVTDKYILRDSSSYVYPISNIQTPIENPISERRKIENYKYNPKATSIINMFASYVGKELVEQALQEYVNVFKFGNAGYKDFLSILSKYSSKTDMDIFFHSWIYQPGFPLITVNPFNDDNNNLIAVQTPYGCNNSSEPQANVRLSWRIPIDIKYSCDNQTVYKYLINSQEALIENKCANSTAQWYKLNYGANGFYRVKYDKTNWINLRNQLLREHKVFPVTDRANLISDVFALALSSHTTIGTALDFVNYLENENDYVPHAIAFKYLNFITKNVVKDKKVAACMKSFILRIARKVLKRFEEKKSFSHDETKAMILLTEIDLADNKEKSRVYENEFLKWLVSNERDNIHGAWRELIFKVGITHGSHYEFDKLLDYYKRTDSIAERTLVIKTLAVSPDTSLLNKLMSSIDSKAIIYFDDRLKVLLYTCKNSVGRPIAWTYITKNWDFLYTMNDNNDEMENVIRSCLSEVSNHQDLLKVDEFMKTKHLGVFENMFQQMNEQIKLNIRLTTRENEVADWFEDQNSKCLS